MQLHHPFKRVMIKQTMERLLPVVQSDSELTGGSL